MVRMVRGTMKSWNQRDKIELRWKWKHGDEWRNCKNEEIESMVLPYFRENDEIKKRKNVFLQRHNPALIGHERWKQGDEIEIEIKRNEIRETKMKSEATETKMKSERKRRKWWRRGTQFTLTRGTASSSYQLYSFFLNERLWDTFYLRAKEFGKLNQIKT